MTKHLNIFSRNIYIVIDIFYSIYFFVISLYFIFESHAIVISEILHLSNKLLYGTHV